MGKKPEKGWMIILRASEDYAADGGEDETFLFVFRALERAKHECVEHLKDFWKEAGTPEESSEIEWAETTENPKRGLKKYLGRPKADFDGYFEVFEAVIV